MVSIAPSLMCADFLHLATELQLLREIGVDCLHVDIMDGRYVPNYTLGPAFCERVAAFSRLPLDIHLMVEDADAAVPLFAGLPAAVVSIHPDTARHPLRTLEHIRSVGAGAGVVLAPAAAPESLRYLLPLAQRVCLMTVNPGFAGQKLIPGSIEKIAETAAWLAERGWEGDLEVDGNVSWDNIPQMVAAGATMLVAGTSSLYERGGDLRTNLLRLRGLVGR